MLREPLGLPRGFPEDPFLNWVARGGCRYPTSFFDVDRLFLGTAPAPVDTAANYRLTH